MHTAHSRRFVVNRKSWKLLVTSCFLLCCASYVPSKLGFDVCLLLPSSSFFSASLLHKKKTRFAHCSTNIPQSFVMSNKRARARASRNSEPHRLFDSFAENAAMLRRLWWTNCRAFNGKRAKKKKTEKSIACEPTNRGGMVAGAENSCTSASGSGCINWITSFSRLPTVWHAVHTKSSWPAACVCSLAYAGT